MCRYALSIDMARPNKSTEFMHEDMSEVTTRVDPVSIRLLSFDDSVDSTRVQISNVIYKAIVEQNGEKMKCSQYEKFSTNYKVIRLKNEVENIEVFR